MLGGIFFRQNFKAKKDIPVESLIWSLNQFKTAESTGHWQNEDVFLANGHYRNSPQSKHREIPLVHQATGTVMVSWSRLDNRQELSDKLSIPLSDSSHCSDDALILQAYLRWGKDCTKYFFGDFCFAIYNARTRELFCARDPMGVKPFYYYLNDEVFIFSSTVAFLHQTKLIPMQPDQKWATLFLINRSMDFEKTAYKNIYKLKPAHTIVIDPRNSKMNAYFKFDPYQQIYFKSSEEYVEGYREKLTRAVQSRIHTDYGLGSELSGGVDSSSVTALAAKNFGQSLDHFYTFGFANSVHEPSYILALSQAHQLKNNFICCADPTLRAEEIQTRAIAALGYPIEHGNATGHILFYELAQKFNVRTLLSGFGGDEFVTTIHPNIAIFQMYVEKQYRKLYRSLCGNKLIRFLRLLKTPLNYLKHQREYNPEFLEAYKGYWLSHIINPLLVEKYALEDIFFESAKFDQGSHHLNEFTLEKRMQPFVATRTENCTLMANTYGIDYAWPLLDVRLIEYFLSVPVCEKVRDGRSRYLHGKAVEDIVPAKIIWKKGKYMGEPANSFNKVPEVAPLKEDLHPDLECLLDMEKWQRQLKQLTMENHHSSMMQRYQIRRSLSSITALDRWLKHYHSKGVSWYVPEENSSLEKT